jgi:hypothetical protein
MPSERNVDALPAQDDAAQRGCVEALTHLSLSTIPFLVGGTYALRRYTKTARDTKDLDIFVLPSDVHRVLSYFEELGYRTELTFPHWLGKVFVGETLVDIIFSSGNGLARVDECWFTHAVDHDVCGVPTRLCPPEEMLWSKAFVQERERFDGADVLHLFWHMGTELRWPHLLRRFGPHWRVLLAHLVLFGFAYPDRRDQIPAWVLEELTARLATENSEAANVCNGTLLSREQYLDDVQAGHYRDSRLRPAGPMTREQIEIWTAGIKEPH